MKEIICADAVQWANEYEGELFHALFCDSPYHLTSITKRFGKNGSAPAKGGVYARSSKGFMGQQWDGGDVAFRPETWAAFMRVLHPGAFGMTFAGSRGWHRLAVAVEGLLTLTPNQLLTQADLLAVAREKKDWRIVEDVENALREMAGVKDAITQAGFIIHPSIFGWAYGSGFPKATRVKGDERFDGHRYGLQALKPALEPIIVFQKPYEGRPIDNIQATGAGTLNIDAGRIGVESIPSNRWTDSAHPFGNGAGNDYETVMSQGRWASNFILLDEGAAAALDRQSGHLVSGQPAGIRKADNHIYGHYEPGQPITGFGDEGGASRFFFNVQEQLDSADPVYYEAKAGSEERNLGLREFIPQDLVRQGLAGENNNPSHKNIHPTLKPLALTRYLASLLLPPAEYSPRRVFVPFAGVASEMIGAMQAGWDEIVGVELTEKYIPIAKARIEYWRNRGWQTPLFELPKE